VLTHLQIASVLIRDEARIVVRGDHAAGAAYAAREPACHPASIAPDLQAAPAGGDSKRGEPLGGGVVEQRLQGEQALALLRPCLVVDVVTHA
jgi:hypothetical protein